MCGLAGLWTGKGGTEDDLRVQVEAMAATLSHRGPDDKGTWVDPAAGIALGFRRLAIIDLTAAGHQPMSSRSGRYTAVYNGEIYNYGSIRETLQRDGVAFRGHSDTEVMLAAIERWGFGAALRQFVGMFAIALWDREERSLTLARDRLGVKPLYYSQVNGVVLFGSELRALQRHPYFRAELDREAVVAYLRHLYIPGPSSIFAGVRKLPPGTTLTIRVPDRSVPEPEPYWSIADTIESGRASPLKGSDDDVVSALEDLLTEAVRLRLRADVPLGAFLSGGVDSSLVTALAQRHSPRPLRTYSVGFEEGAYDESHHAAAVARYLGTDHVEVRLTGRDALDLIPTMAEVFDEPHADASQIPAYVLCRAARQDVAVALTGDGGDEVFGGYNRYTYFRRVMQLIRRLPRPARMALAGLISAIPTGIWDGAAGAAAPLLPPSLRLRLAGEKMAKVARLMKARSEAEAYRMLVSAVVHPEVMVAGAGNGMGTSEPGIELGQLDLALRLQAADQLTYLPDDQLAKVDRVSMSVGLEARVPLVDHRVVELSWRLGMDQKWRSGVGKWALRQVLYRHVPRHLVDRQKMGLSLPISGWLRGPLRDWAEGLLAPAVLGMGGIIRAGPVRSSWERLLRGQDGEALGIWAILMLQAWRERYHI